MSGVVIIDALRTPIGKYRGSLASISAVDLGVHVVRGVLDRWPGVRPDVAEVIFGNVVQTGSGQNVARQVSVASGLGVDVPATTINEVCASGMKAVTLAALSITAGKADVVIAGGTENMSAAPMWMRRDADATEATEATPTVLTDGLIDAFSGRHMGVTAENVATQWKVTRAEQDAFALASQKKAVAAVASGAFRGEILPITVDDVIVDCDESIRPDSSLEKLAALTPVFEPGGTVTAGNASPLNDGACAVLLASKEYAEKHGLEYMAELVDSTEVGVDPAIMGISPVKAISTLLDRNGLEVGDIDIFEVNEAFASASVAVENELGLPKERTNIHGGAIALGHPIGATGARLVGAVAHRLAQTGKRHGVAALCVGGGLGLAVLLRGTERA